MDLDPVAAAEKEALLASYNTEAPPIERQQWFRQADAWLAKRGGKHWWCKHDDVTFKLIEVLKFRHAGPPRKIWATICEQTQACSNCMKWFYRAQLDCDQPCVDEDDRDGRVHTTIRGDYNEEDGREVLASLQILNAEKLMPLLTSTDPHAMMAGVYEVLVYDGLMLDLELCNALCVALDKLVKQYAFTLPATGGRYPGLCRLLAHPSSNVRALVLPLVQGQGVFTQWEGRTGAKISCGQLLTEWTSVLQTWCMEGGLSTWTPAPTLDWTPGSHTRTPRPGQQQLPGAGGGGGGGGGAHTPLLAGAGGGGVGGGAHAPLLESGRPRSVQPPECVWLGLKVVLQLLPPEVMEEALFVEHPALLSAILSASGQSPGPSPDADRLRLYRTILQCLVIVLRGVGPALWSRVLPDGAGGAAGGQGGYSGGGGWEFGEAVQRCAIGATELVDLAMQAMECVHDEPSHKVVVQAHHALLDALADSPSRQEEAMNNLLQYSLLHVVMCTWRRPPYTPLIKSQAALASLGGMRRAISRAYYPTSFGAQQWGNRACSEVVRAALPDTDVAPRVTQEAAKLLVMVLQVDSTVLAAALDPLRAQTPDQDPSLLALTDSPTAGPSSELHPATIPTLTADQWLAQLSKATVSEQHVLQGARTQGGLAVCLPRQLRVCPAVWEGLDRSQAAEVHLGALEQASCCPAYWCSLAIRPCNHPAVVAALLAAVGHVASVVAPPRTAGGVAPHQLTFSPGLEEDSLAVPVSQHAGALLHVLRDHAGTLLNRILERGNVLLCGHSQMGLLTGEPGTLQALEQQALAALVRIVLGADASLSLKAACALSAHWRLPSSHPTLSSALEQLLPRALADSCDWPAFLASLLDALDTAVVEVDARDPVQALCSVQLNHLLACAKALVVAADALPASPLLEQRLPPLCAALVCLTHKLMQPRVKATGAGWAQARANQASMLQLLPGCWYYLGLEAPDEADGGSQYQPWSLDTHHHTQSKASQHNLHSRVCASAITSLIVLLKWTLTGLSPAQPQPQLGRSSSLLAASAASATATGGGSGGSADAGGVVGGDTVGLALVKCLSVLAGFSQDAQVVELARQVMAPSSLVSEQVRLGLATIFPTAAPPSLSSQHTTTLVNLPSRARSAAASHAQPAGPAGPAGAAGAVPSPARTFVSRQATVVIDLTLDDDDDGAVQQATQQQTPAHQTQQAPQLQGQQHQRATQLQTQQAAQQQGQPLAPQHRTQQASQQQAAPTVYPGQYPPTARSQFWPQQAPAPAQMPSAQTRPTGIAPPSALTRTPSNQQQHVPNVNNQQQQQQQRPQEERDLDLYPDDDLTLAQMAQRRVPLAGKAATDAVAPTFIGKAGADVVVPPRPVAPHRPAGPAGASDQVIKQAARALVREIHNIGTVPTANQQPTTANALNRLLSGMGGQQQQQQPNAMAPAAQRVARLPPQRPPQPPPQPVAQPPVQPPPKPVLQLMADDEFLQEQLLTQMDEARMLRQREKEQGGRQGLAAAARVEVRPAQLLNGGMRGPAARFLRAAAPPPPALRMDDVHSLLLGWDLQLDVVMHASSARGGGSGVQGSSGASKAQGSRGPRPDSVPLRFPQGLQQYVDIFKCLLVEELRAGIASSVEEVSSAWDPLKCRAVRIQHVQRVDAVQVLTCNVEPANDNGPRAFGSSFRTDDLLLLTIERLRAGELTDGKLPSLRILAMVTESKHGKGGSEEITVKVVLPPDASGGITFGTGSLAGPGRVHDKLGPGARWFATQVHSLTPQLREFQALCSSHKLPDSIRSFLLQPTASAAAGPSTTARLEAAPSTTAPPAPITREAAEQLLQAVGIPTAMRDVLIRTYNTSQQAAVAASLSTRCQFTLVQGPPGTGKTSAILGIVSALLSGCKPSAVGQPPRAAGGQPTVVDEAAAVAKAQFKLPSAAKRKRGTTLDGTEGAGGAEGDAGPQGEGGGGVLRLGKQPAIRVLVCAQSNAAIDELVSRLAKDGILRTDGTRRAPGMVRLGRSEATHADVRDFHVDAVAERLAGEHRPLAEASAKQATAGSRISQLDDQLAALQAQIDALDALDTDLQQGQGAGRAEDDMDMDGGGAEEGLLAGDTRGGVAAPGNDGLSDRGREQRRLLLRQKRYTLAQLGDARRAERGGNQEVGRARRELRQSVIRAAEITVCTLSVSGGELAHQSWNTGPAAGFGAAGTTGGPPRFDALVIDEAAQALEPATIIPFSLLKPDGKVVLVGDPRQLPPTVLSQLADAARLSQSLFERLQKAGVTVHMLTQQYRMHPAISRFPSQYFYSSSLMDGVSVSARTAPHHATCKGFGPLVVWDLVEGKEGRGYGGGAKGGSLQNIPEAEFAASLYRVFISEHRSFSGSIAVLSPYRAQVALLKQAFWPYLPRPEAATGHQSQGPSSQRECSSQEGTQPPAHTVEFSTVDGFQGREADVVIMSCVRAAASAVPYVTGAAGPAAAEAQDGSRAGGRPANGLGFLNDVRRMNVALTRARYSLWVVGHAATLNCSAPWAALLQHADAQGQLLQAQGSNSTEIRACILGKSRSSQGHQQTPGRQGSGPLAPDRQPENGRSAGQKHAGTGAAVGDAPRRPHDIGAHNVKDGREGKDERDRRDERDGKGGKDGREGKDGRDRRDERDGKGGKDGRDGKDGRHRREERDGRDAEDGRDRREERDGRDGRDRRDSRDGQDGRDRRGSRDGRDGRDRSDGGEAGRAREGGAQDGRREKDAAASRGAERAGDRNGKEGVGMGGRAGGDGGTKRPAEQPAADVNGGGKRLHVAQANGAGAIGQANGAGAQGVAPAPLPPADRPADVRPAAVSSKQGTANGPARPAGTAGVRDALGRTTSVGVGDGRPLKKVRLESAAAARPATAAGPGGARPVGVAGNASGTAARPVEAVRAPAAPAARPAGVGSAPAARPADAGRAPPPPAARPADVGRAAAAPAARPVAAAGAPRQEKPRPAEVGRAPAAPAARPVGASGPPRRDEPRPEPAIPRERAASPARAQNNSPVQERRQAPAGGVGMPQRAAQPVLAAAAGYQQHIAQGRGRGGDGGGLPGLGRGNEGPGAQGRGAGRGAGSTAAERAAAVIANRQAGPPGPLPPRPQAAPPHLPQQPQRQQQNPTLAETAAARLKDSEGKGPEWLLGRARTTNGAGGGAGAAAEGAGRAVVGRREAQAGPSQ